jgi:type IV pilus assembly protein PilY1
VAPTLLWKKGCPNEVDDDRLLDRLHGNRPDLVRAIVMKSLGYVDGSSVQADADGRRRLRRQLRGPRSEHLHQLVKGQPHLRDRRRNRHAPPGVRHRPAGGGDVFVVPDSTTGMAKWAYAADTGGNLYRISGTDSNTQFSTTDPSLWTITKIASLGCATASAGCSANRKFLLRRTWSTRTARGDPGRLRRPRAAAHLAVGVRRQQLLLHAQDNPTDSNWLSRIHAAAPT